VSVYLDAIGAVLTNAGVVGGTTGWAMLKLASGDSPIQTVTLYEVGGLEPETATDRSWGQPRFQVVTRAATDKLANDKAWAILAALHRASVSGFDHFLSTQSTPIAIGPDQNGHPRYAVNFRGGAS
jgi:Bacteriophage minor capsid protein